MVAAPTPTWADQGGHQVRFEWGPIGLQALGGGTVVVVDVLRFSTAVTVAVDRGISVFPYRWKDGTARHFARQQRAMLAEGADGTPSLSPASLSDLEPGTRVVLPSPNGSTCAALASESGATVIVACFRNAGAVARWLTTCPGPIAVVACGEQWPDGSLRPSLEDLLGAGALLDGLPLDLSAEATAAAAAWRDARDDIDRTIRTTGSGRELVERGLAGDLEIAAQVDVSDTVPILTDGAFVDAARPTSP